jgi:hypothetical protein
MRYHDVTRCDFQMKTLLVVSFLAFGQTTTPNTPTTPRLDFINLGRSRLIIVRIPAGKFWMGSLKLRGCGLWAEGESWVTGHRQPVA